MYGLLKYKLKKKRLFTVKTSINFQNNILKLHVLFMPRIKKRPPNEELGNFSNLILYYPRYNGKNRKIIKTFRNYVRQRREKNFIFPVQRDTQINR